MPFTVLGGQLIPAISLSIEGKLPVSDEDVKRNVAQSSALDLKTYREFKPTKKRLAVVGGGPSIKDHAHEIKCFDGDVWAINGAYGWCRERGIDATFFGVDPHPIVAKWCKGATRALLESRVDPTVFDLLKDADVYTFDVGNAKGQIAAGGSAVTSVPHIAVRVGYQEVTLFGCESCYPVGETHAYTNERRTEEMLLECGGVQYLTAPDFYMQAIELSRYIREVPEFIKERSGGLLRAMVEDPEFRILWISEELGNSMNPVKRKITGAMVMADNLEAFGMTERDVA